ncbi:NAD-dependent epimerase/dehydratase family protein [Cryobacterium psychrophilum]|uniref:NAD-dependent epimerase/dehydratase family protein n=1 Tax=Cryobacterium psychrophilum TaxID=41988 RepID=A0A4Y8KMK5_9MICO|nr:NAD-dependent epimerase/dehydratase family protein [Cryobacterium psychrophilum]TFD77487.1 NAD-dependent epimerase/dehydratase family protein [Cryobacterium psychrophilum]
MGKSALIIGGTGQLGVAAAGRLGRAGWDVTVTYRGDAPADPRGATRSIRLDHADSDALFAAARGRDLVLDTAAFDAENATQLAGLAGDVGSLVVISTGMLYAPAPDTEPLTEEAPVINESGMSYPAAKVRLEQALLAVRDLPVSILRPGAIHGPHTTELREWFFIKRVFDGRRSVLLADHGGRPLSTSATVNVAELVLLCAEQPGLRVLNAVDEQAHSPAEMARLVFALMQHDAEVHTFAGPPRGGVGASPWDRGQSEVLSMAAAREQLGYRPAVSYVDGLAIDIRWASDAVTAAQERGASWRQVFPYTAARHGERDWFRYAAEDAFLPRP